MQPSAEPALPGVYLLEVVELAGRWRVRADQLLAGTPVSAEGLRDPATRVPIPVCAEVVERAHRLTREPALALYMGMQMRLSSHGFLGFAAMTAATVGEAIDLAVRFSGTRTTALGLALYVEGATASLVIEERAPLGALREFAVLSLAVGLWNIGQVLTGRSPEGVAELCFAAPDYVRATSLAGMIRFGQPANRLVFPAADLATPLKTADPVALQLARAQCERELAALVDAGLAGACARRSARSGRRCPPSTRWPAGCTCRPGRSSASLPCSAPPTAPSSRTCAATGPCSCSTTASWPSPRWPRGSATPSPQISRAPSASGPAPRPPRTARARRWAGAAEPLAPALPHAGAGCTSPGSHPPRVWPRAFLERENM
jgi:hypothetical protein